MYKAFEFGEAYSMGTRPFAQVWLLAFSNGGIVNCSLLLG